MLKARVRVIYNRVSDRVSDSVQRAPTSTTIGV